MDAIKNTFEKIKILAEKETAFAELLISGSEQLQLSSRKGKLETFKSSHSQRAGFRVVVEDAQGYAWTENFAEEALVRAFQEALVNAKTLRGSGEKIPTASFSPPTSPPVGLDIAEDVDVEKKIEMAIKLEAAALEADPRVTSVPYSSFADSKSWVRVINSAGVDKEFRQKYYSGHAYALAQDGESTKTGGESFFVRKFSQVDPQQIGRESAGKALKHLGAQKLMTGNYPVVLDSEVAESLIGLLEPYFSAKKIYEKTSLLAGKLNQAIASTAFNLMDDPLRESSRGVRPFDSEGCTSQKTVLIEKGVIKSYLTNLEYAQKMKLPHTASASRSPSSDMEISASNLIVAKGNVSLESLLRRYPKLIYLTGISGLHSGFKETTGDFSLPGEGFLYEAGQCRGPVDQFVFSGNLLEMMLRVEDLSDRYAHEHAPVLVPDLLIQEMSFAGG